MCQEKQPEPPNPDFLHVVKQGGHIAIYEIDKESGEKSLVYDGAPDLGCMMDAIGIHFGFEGAEIHEEESPEVDFLDVHKADSLDNRSDKDKENDEPGEEEECGLDLGGGGEGGDEEGEGDEVGDPIDITIPEQDHGIPEWGDDDD